MKRILLFVFALATLNLLAQEQNISLLVHGNVLFPTGQFGESIGDQPRLTRRFGLDHGDNVGLATTGFGAGLELSQNIYKNKIAWLISSKLFMNPVDNSQVEDFFQNELGDSVSVTFEHGIWTNIPIYTGFSYTWPALDNLSLIASVQAGLAITQQPYRKAFLDGELIEETTFRFTADFGYEFGLGMEFRQKYHLGLRYFELVTPRYEGTRKLNESFFTSIPKREMNIDGDERPVSMLVLFLGYKF